MHPYFWYALLFINGACWTGAIYNMGRVHAARSVLADFERDMHNRLKIQIDKVLHETFGNGTYRHPVKFVHVEVVKPDQPSKH